MSGSFGVCIQPKCSDEDLPSTTEMVKNLAKSLKDIVVGSVVNGSELLVSDEVVQHRWNICLSCPLFIQESKRCSECGCFMEAKVKFTQTECPVGKWGRV